MEDSGQFHPPAALHRENSPRYALDKQLGESQRLWSKEKSLTLPGIEPRFLGSPARNLVCIQTGLCLIHSGPNKIILKRMASSVMWRRVNLA
jgi:hypothetical protein